MRLESAHIRNFKLLEDVELRFSQDPAHPLTVIRAEKRIGQDLHFAGIALGNVGKSGNPNGNAFDIYLFASRPTH